MTEYNVDDVDDEVDNLLSGRPEIHKKVKDNRRFIKKIQNVKIDPNYAEVPVFGVKSVNVNAILKDNIFHRGIFVVDKLCRMHRNMTYEQLKKYVVKKRTVPFKALWILLLILGVGIFVIIFIIFILPAIMGGVGGII